MAPSLANLNKYRKIQGDHLDGTRATARQRLFFPEGWEEMKNRMKENVSNQENSPAERGGRTYPETRNALSMQSAGGGRGRTQEGSRDG
ncbi:hypothetical protein TNCV_994151 [Trichonephila clavipes]|nr:hypothetical protein TNCV_994151 [Trichonephila clavipes]